MKQMCYFCIINIRMKTDRKKLLLVAAAIMLSWCLALLKVIISLPSYHDVTQLVYIDVPNAWQSFAFFF
jgi:hypothetical protein